MPTWVPWWPGPGPPYMVVVVACRTVAHSVRLLKLPVSLGLEEPLRGLQAQSGWRLQPPQRPVQPRPGAHFSSTEAAGPAPLLLRNIPYPQMWTSPFCSRRWS